MDTAPAPLFQVTDRSDTAYVDSLHFVLESRRDEIAVGDWIFNTVKKKEVRTRFRDDDDDDDAWKYDLSKF